MNSDNWCQVCEEACQDHPTICSVCGTALTATPSDALMTPNPNAAGSGDIHAQLLNDMYQASRDLRNILGNLRGQMQDLDVLTRNILQEGENIDNNLPREFWDPQNASSGPAYRPTSMDTLKKIPRFVLNDQSTMFRQASLQVSPGNDVTTPSCLLSTTPAVRGQSQVIPNATSSVTSAATKTNGNATVGNSALKFDCVLGEFGPAGEYSFGMGGTSLVLASPVTGKGGLDSATKSHISRLSNDSGSRKVVLFMQRGDGLTYVQKARMAQNAGAAAVIIGNNTSSPWPYVMKDSKGESMKPEYAISIPVAMIKEVDGKEIIRMFQTRKKTVLELERKSQSQPPIPKQIVFGIEKELQDQGLCCDSMEENDPSGDSSIKNNLMFHLSCDLTITEQSCDCPVCCEQLQNYETVVQLPGCGHVFHESCAMVWLKSHNTCPYCRRELPTDDPEYERERRQRQQRTTSGRSNGDRDTANQNGASFYG